jgi:xylan 1,4-beta-xylosidase
LRADWQAQLKRCREELGFQHVRFHGLLSDDVGTVVRHQNRLIYSFFNADQIIDFLLSIDMRPFVELSFMPTALASGSRTVFHYRGNVTPHGIIGSGRRSSESWSGIGLIDTASER